MIRSTLNQNEQRLGARPLADPVPQFRSGLLDTMTPADILGWAIKHFGDQLLVTTALNAGGVYLMHQLARIAPRHPVWFIDTGQHFEETLAYRDRLIRDFGYPIRTAGPIPVDDDRCCAKRKVVAARALRYGKRAWLTAIRREQGGERAAIRVVEEQPDRTLKISPLAAMTRAEIDAALQAAGIPQHPLRNSGYRSVGCARCTVPVGDDQAERDGRFATEQRTECGLHRRRAPTH